MELERVREEIAKFEFQLILYAARDHGFSMSAYSWEELEPRFKGYYRHRADQILSTKLGNHTLKEIIEMIDKGELVKKIDEQDIKREFIRVECIGMVGKFPTPNGMQTFYDTGCKVSGVDLAEALTLQHSFYALSQTEESRKEIYDFATRIAKKANVYPVGFAALADDGRVLVTEPFFESRVEK